MKRFGEKATREAIANGATIRAWDYYTGNGYRVMIDDEPAGYIVADLFFKLKNEGALIKDHWAYSFTDYKAPETAQEITTAEAAEMLTDALRVFEAAGVISDLKVEPLSAKTAQEWEEESAAVYAATLPFAEAIGQANIEAAEETQEEAEPEYLDERWPESNTKAGIWYSLDFENGTPAIYNTVEDFRSGVHQAKYNGWTIAAAWRHDDNTRTRRAIIPETRQERTDRENREHCKRIAEDVEAYASGDAYKCPHCGEVHNMDDYEETEHENEDGCTCYTCPSCGEEIEESDLEAVSLYDYFADCLDVEYRCGSDKEYRSVCIMVACGGPNIYIDTDEKAVLLYWWRDRARYYLSNDAVDAVDEWAEEYWNCL